MDEATEREAGERPVPQDDGDDIVLRIMTVAEESGDLDDDSQALLWQVLTGDGHPPPEPESQRTVVNATQPAGAYLKSITVAGFRGIGPEARLDLHPAPGLVVVAGRNGSGKSTFSEAVEVALTRTSYRWDAKKGAGDWRAGWRNLHADDPCHIRVELAEEGVGTTTVAANLGTATKEPREGIFRAQRAGQQRDRSADSSAGCGHSSCTGRCGRTTNWAASSESRPSDLYEKLWTILGLGRIADAWSRRLRPGDARRRRRPRTYASR